MTEQQPAQHLDVQIDPETEKGVHADFVSLWHTPDTFVLDFASHRQPPFITEDADTGQRTIVLPTRIVSRVKIPPRQVFEFMKALNQQLELWERETGQTPPAEPAGS